mgnify:CR=1 FL=1
MLARPSAAARTANCTVKRNISISIEVYTFHEKAEEPRRFLVRRGTASWNTCTWPGPSHQELPYAMMPRPMASSASCRMASHSATALLSGRAARWGRTRRCSGISWFRDRKYGQQPEPQPTVRTRLLSPKAFAATKPDPRPTFEHRGLCNGSLGGTRLCSGLLLVLMLVLCKVLVS